jgi:pyruvate/2-oxoglutarate dehydrogenase complex dihydrolipoamide acyltransferase (E2) component
VATHIALPPLGWSQDAIFQQWLRDDGDWVSPGMTLCVVQCGGSRRTLTAVEAGFLRIPQKGVVAGTRLLRGQRLAVILGPGEGRDDLTVAPPAMPVAPELPGSAAADLEETARTARPERQRASPRARCLAQANGLDVEQVRGTGHAKRIVAHDVETVLRRQRSRRGETLGQCLASASFRVVQKANSPALQVVLATALWRFFHDQLQEDLSWAYAVWSDNDWRYSERPASDPALAAAQREQCRQPTPPLRTTAIIYDLSDQQVDYYVPSIIPGCRLAVAIGRAAAVAGQPERISFRLTLVGDGHAVDGVRVLQCLQAIGDNLAECGAGPAA